MFSDFGWDSACLERAGFYSEFYHVSPGWFKLALCWLALLVFA